jgi:hypothetical protein
MPGKHIIYIICYLLSQNSSFWGSEIMDEKPTLLCQFLSRALGAATEYPRPSQGQQELTKG